MRLRLPQFLGLVALVGTLSAARAYSQIQALPRETPGQTFANVSFEVVSVKESLFSWQQAGPPVMSMSGSGLFVAARITVWQLFGWAYDVRPYQIAGEPEWMHNALFDIVARAPNNFQMGEARAMLRSLLADRFALVVQKENRVIPTYSLEWADGKHRLGPGIRLSPQCSDAPSAGQPECRSGSGWEDGGIFVRRGSLGALVVLLTSATGRPVIDKTRLAGVFDVDVKAPGILPGLPQRLNGDPLEGVSIFTAVREQLNLKLVPAKEKMEVLVVGRLERPTPN